MDKASVRILFLALIAVMFIGQAVYDFVKKHRSQISRHRPSPRPKLSAPPAQAVPKASASYPHISIQSSPSDSISPSDSVVPLEQSVKESDPTSETTLTPGSDELRRAIIWSEILKRKF